MWRCIRDIQRAMRGQMPERTARVRDEDGSECTSEEAQQERWKRYFTKIFNIQSEFDVEELRKVRQRSPRPEMAELPSEEELQNAVLKLKNGKAGGESGILPEMVKMASSEDVFVSRLLELVQDVCMKCNVPGE